MAASSQPVQDAKVVGEDSVAPLLDVVSGAGVLERQRKGLAPGRSLTWISVTFNPSVSLVMADQDVAVGDLLRLMLS
jgi:hypothetical protein